jgi:hypothetical protein
MTTIVELQTKLDAFKAAREMRLEEQRKVDNLKKQENELQYQLITYLQDNPEINGIMGSTHKAVIKESTVPIIEDLQAFQAYIAETQQWDLAYQLRASAPAIRDRWEDGVTIPGVGTAVDTKLSVTKI